MYNPLIALIILVVAFIIAIICLIVAIIKKAKDNDELVLPWVGAAIGLLISFAILTPQVVGKYSKCPNCEKWISTDFCQECGWEANPHTNCPNCGKEFAIDSTPNFCPTCGTKPYVNCQNCGKEFAVDNIPNFCPTCGTKTEN